MAWDDDLQLFAVKQRDEYIHWAIFAEPDEDDDPVEFEKSRSTKSGYAKYNDKDRLKHPEKHAKTYAEYSSRYSYGEWLADNSWNNFLFKKNKRIGASRPRDLFIYAGQPLPETITLPDSTARGGFRTYPITTVTLDQWGQSLTKEGEELDLWIDEHAKDMAAYNAMKAEAKDDGSVLVVSLAVKVTPKPTPEPEPV